MKFLKQLITQMLFYSSVRLVLANPQLFITSVVLKCKKPKTMDKSIMHLEILQIKTFLMSKLVLIQEVKLVTFDLLISGNHQAKV